MENHILLHGLVQVHVRHDIDVAAAIESPAHCYNRFVPGAAAELEHVVATSIGVQSVDELFHVESHLYILRISCPIDLLELTAMC